MKHTFKSIGGIVLACLLLGVLAYPLLLSAIHRSSTDSIPPSESSPPAGNVDIAAAPDSHVPPGWVFRLTASAVDDPEAGRTLRATVQFEGAVPACPAGSAHGAQGLAIDRTGALASTSREVEVCLPGCADQVPSAPREITPSRALDLSAFQEEFDRAPEGYTPQGQAALVDWRCGAVAGRVTAAAIAVLACDTDGCGDLQSVNASVYLGAEQGLDLGPARALFALRNTAGLPVVGAVDLQ